MHLMTRPDISALKKRLENYTDLKLASSILYWDQATMMPEVGSGQRGRQLATLANFTHDILVAPETGKLIDEALTWANSELRDNQDASFVREAKRIRDLEARVPSDLSAAMAEHSAKMYSAWAVARPKNDFATLQPLLEKSVTLSQKFSDCFPALDHPMDALIQFSDQGSSVSSVQVMFKDLRSELVPLVQKVKAAKQVDSSCLHGEFEEASQLKFCKLVAEKLGYDFKRGRIDLSPHPFMTRLSGGDIRITTRTRRDDMTDCLFSVIHEVGHALYELGISETLDGNILGNGVSSGVHESQSRLWENLVGRGKPFWDYFYPILQKEFPSFNPLPQTQFLKAINKVEPGLIRVDADELTYNLHVMIRFDLECQVLEGKLAIKDLPDAWNARYKSDLGVTVTNLKDGCIQDVHWFSGSFGGSFQGYTIGNILSAQLYDAAKKDLPKMEDEFAKGEFSSLRQWLNNKLHRWGAMLSPDEVIKHATGENLSSNSYMRYLVKKYSEIYALT
jgi:carboxypeptidase Taq